MDGFQQIEQMRRIEHRQNAREYREKLSLYAFSGAFLGWLMNAISGNPNPFAQGWHQFEVAYGIFAGLGLVIGIVIGGFSYFGGRVGINMRYNGLANDLQKEGMFQQHLQQQFPPSF